MSRSVDIVKQATNDIYNMVHTQNRRLLEQKLDLIYHTVCELEDDYNSILERLQEVESERFN